MALEITKPEQLEAFLADKPIEWSRLIASRAALRVLPIASVSAIRRQHLLAVFRASFVSWVASKYPTQDMTAAAISSAHSVGIPPAISAGSSARSAVRSAARSAVGSVVESITRAAAKAAGSAVRSAALAGENSLVWEITKLDLEALISLSQPVDLWKTRLWPGDVPQWVVGKWLTFIQSQPALVGGYSHWIDWYEGILDGTDRFGTELSLRIALQREGWWSRPAVEVNADIAAWLGKGENHKDELIDKVDEVQKQLIQRPAAASFGWTGDQLSVNAPAPLLPASLAQDFLGEVLLKAVDLRDRLAMTNAAQRVRKSLDGVIAILPEQATDLRPGLLRSRARSLHADATAYAGQFQDGELPVDATAMLLDLSGGLRDLEGCFPELRDIEKEIVALNLKPADVPAVQKHLEEINKAASESPVVADNTKTVMAAGTETMKAEATPNIIEVRTAEQALTTRNLVNAAVQGSIQQILSRVPDTTGRVYEETEKAGRNLIRPVASVGASLLVGSLAGPVAGLAVFALAEYDRLPGIINFIKEAAKVVGLDKPEDK